MTLITRVLRLSCDAAPATSCKPIEPALRLFVPVIRVLSRRRPALGDGVVPVARCAGAIPSVSFALGRCVETAAQNPQGQALAGHRQGQMQMQTQGL